MLLDLAILIIECKLWSSSLCSYVTSSLFVQNIHLSTFFSNTLRLCSSLSVRDHVSHRYRKTSELIVLYTQILMFLDSRQQNKRFRTEWYQALPEFCLHSISSWMKFWFVTIVPKYLNCDTFPNDLFVIFMSRFRPTFWWRDSNIYLVFSTFISRPTSLLASIKVYGFLHAIYVLSQ
jgi:hypothetical protein